MKKNHRSNEQRQGPRADHWVHSGASSTASAPTDTLFVGRAVSVVTRPPALNKNSSGQSVTHTHTHFKYESTARSEFSSFTRLTRPRRRTGRPSKSDGVKESSHEMLRKAMGWAWEAVCLGSSCFAWVDGCFLDEGQNGAFDPPTKPMSF